jgi:hypothetical protein
VLLAVALSAAVARASPATITRHDAAAVAHAINLRRSDLPGYTETSPHATTQDQKFVAEFDKCDRGVPQTRALLVAHSQSFAGSGLDQTPGVSAVVEIWPSAALAERSLTAVPAARYISCFVSYSYAALRSEHPKGVSLRISGATVPPLVQDSDGAFNYRFTAEIRAKPAATAANVRQRSTGLSVAVYFAEFGFVYGQVVVAASLTTIEKPPSRSLEQHLARSLLARTHKAVG